MNPFKNWLDTNFGAPKDASPFELAKLTAEIRRQEIRAKKQERIALFVCVSSIVLTAFVISLSSRQIRETVTKNYKENDVNQTEELDREFDVSLENFENILKEARRF